jgi:hypothetical protein
VIILIFGEEYKLWISSLLISPSTYYSIPLSSNIPLSTLFPNTLSLYSSLSTRCQIPSFTPI